MIKSKFLQTSTIIILSVITGYLTISCTLTRQTDITIEIDDWTDYTHSKSTSPDYDVVFPQDSVNRFDLVISPANWQVMLSDMEANYGPAGSQDGGGGVLPPPRSQLLAAPIVDSDVDPVFVPCSLFFNDIEWYCVGVRFKGNSSLSSCWKAGIMKLPFKLDFDEFEDTYSEIKNQRFYGFKKLSLSSGFEDTSFMREKITADIFRSAGIKAPVTAFYELYIDYGEGPVYFGLYTAVEVVDDTMLETQFGSEDGNCYKPESKFSAGAYTIDDFEKKTNEDEADYSDVELMHSYLHADRTDAATWRSNLETVFDADQFCHWLAVNSVIQNWDTYGNMAHNYYLYNDPSGDLLTWIPWDNNEALQDVKMGALDLALTSDDVSSEWALIRYLMDDSVYRTAYNNYMDAFKDSVFTPDDMTAKYNYYKNIIKDYAAAEEAPYTFLKSDSDFNDAVDSLITHVTERNTAVEAYLATQ